MKKDFSQQQGQRITIANKGKKHFLNVAEITHMCCEKSTVTTYTEEEEFYVSKQLKEFESELRELGFIRINRSTLINKAHIKEYYGGEKKEVELNNGIRFKVSRRKVYLLK